MDKSFEKELLQTKDISQAVITRLPRYFRYLGELKDAGVEKICAELQSQYDEWKASNK